jgi:hypothetical protein
MVQLPKWLPRGIFLWTKFEGHFYFSCDPKSPLKQRHQISKKIWLPVRSLTAWFVLPRAEHLHMYLCLNQPQSCLPREITDFPIDEKLIWELNAMLTVRIPSTVKWVIFSSPLIHSDICCQIHGYIIYFFITTIGNYTIFGLIVACLARRRKRKLSLLSAQIRRWLNDLGLWIEWLVVYHYGRVVTQLKGWELLKPN